MEPIATFRGCSFPAGCPCLPGISCLCNPHISPPPSSSSSSSANDESRCAHARYQRVYFRSHLEKCNQRSDCRPPPSDAVTQSFGKFVLIVTDRLHFSYGCGNSSSLQSQCQFQQHHSGVGAAERHFLVRARCVQVAPNCVYIKTNGVCELAFNND